LKPRALIPFAEYDLEVEGAPEATASEEPEQVEEQPSAEDGDAALEAAIDATAPEVEAAEAEPVAEVQKPALLRVEPLYGDVVRVCANNVPDDLAPKAVESALLTEARTLDGVTGRCAIVVLDHPDDHFTVKKLSSLVPDIAAALLSAGAKAAGRKLRASEGVLTEAGDGSFGPVGTEVPFDAPPTPLFSIGEKGQDVVVVNVNADAVEFEGDRMVERELPGQVAAACKGAVVELRYLSLEQEADDTLRHNAVFAARLAKARLVQDSPSKGVIRRLWPSRFLEQEGPYEDSRRCYAVDLSGSTMDVVGDLQQQAVHVDGILSQGALVLARSDSTDGGKKPVLRELVELFKGRHPWSIELISGGERAILWENNRGRIGLGSLDGHPETTLARTSLIARGKDPSVVLDEVSQEIHEFADRLKGRVVLVQLRNLGEFVVNDDLRHFFVDLLRQIGVQGVKFATSESMDSVERLWHQEQGYAFELDPKPVELLARSSSGVEPPYVMVRLNANGLSGEDFVESLRPGLATVLGESSGTWLFVDNGAEPIVNAPGLIALYLQLGVDVIGVHAVAQDEGVSGYLEVVGVGSGVAPLIGQQYELPKGYLEGEAELPAIEERQFVHLEARTAEGADISGASFFCCVEDDATSNPQFVRQLDAAADEVGSEGLLLLSSIRVLSGDQERQLAELVQGRVAAVAIWKGVEKSTTIQWASDSAAHLDGATLECSLSNSEQEGAVAESLNVNVLAWPIRSHVLQLPTSKTPCGLLWLDVGELQTLPGALLHQVEEWWGANDRPPAVLVNEGLSEELKAALQKRLFKIGATVFGQIRDPNKEHDVCHAELTVSKVEGVSAGQKFKIPADALRAAGI
jgi:hypothetical protein